MKELISFLGFLRAAIGYKLYVWLAFILFAAFLDGMSVGLFLPILESGTGSSQLTDFVNSAASWIGIGYSLPLALLLMVGMFMLRTGFLVYQEIFSSRLVTGLLATTKRRLVDNIFSANYIFFASQEIGYFTNAVTIEYNRVIFAFRSCMRMLVSFGFTIIYISLPLWISPFVTSIVVLSGVPLLFLVRKINRITRDYSIRSTRNNEELQSGLIQSLTNFKYLKSTNSTHRIIGRVSGAINEQAHILFRQSVLNAFTSKTTELITILLAAIVLFYNVHLMGYELVQVLFLLFLIRRAVGHALSGYADYRDFVGAAGSIQVFNKLEKELSENLEIDNPDGATPDFSQALKLDNVYQSYDGSTPVLKGVSIEIPPRSIIAIVGDSGAGKTTVASLLTGLLKPDKGSIKIGNIDYEDINQKKLRSLIGYVTQENVIFTDSIRNNIDLWETENESSDLDAKKMDSVLDKSLLQDFIRSLPDGLETALGDNGLNISGGQRQRINIARELYKDVQMLILDEATSSLDSVSEKEIRGNIEEMKGRITMVIIAHRLSTIRSADQILVLSEGKIVEQGSFHELYEHEGVFRKMVDYQELVQSRGK